MSAFQSTSSSLSPLRTIKFTSTEATTTGGMETRLAIGAAAGSSSFHRDGTGIDVPAGRALRTPKGNDAGNEDDDDGDPPPDGAVITTILEG
jgi:hypothetical protein